jgi:DNA-binding transcriptional MocR family regulator
VRHAFDLALLNLRQDTGEIMLTRDELAERMKCSPQDVSKAMGQLAKMGVILKGERRRVAGLKGPGPVPYFVNPHAAWNGSTAIRDLEAQRQTPPLLALMEGGKK